MKEEYATPRPRKTERVTGLEVDETGRYLDGPHPEESDDDDGENADDNKRGKVSPESSEEKA